MEAAAGVVAAAAAAAAVDVACVVGSASVVEDTAGFGCTYSYARGRSSALG